MATFNQTRVGGKLFKQLALAAALCTASVANAGVLTFEGVKSPFVFSGDVLNVGKYTVSSYNGSADPGFSGMFINGADQADICASAELKCPQNNTSSYFASLADSFFYVELTDGTKFHLESFDASFIGTGGPLMYGVILLQGFNEFGAMISQVQVDLPGPANGQYNFGNVVLGDAFAAEYSFVRFLGYGCPAVGSCSRGQNGANFAVDNIVMTYEGEVPEPATLGLLGLGLLGMSALRRRKQAA